MADRADHLLALGAAARQWREHAGLTQRQLAEITGIHQRWISNLETGVRSPTYESLRRLADGLGVPLWQLIRTADLIGKGEPEGQGVDPPG